MFGSMAKSEKFGKKNNRDDVPVSEILKSERLRQELQIVDIAESLGIPASRLAALEQEQFDIFPTQLAILSALRQYARALKLNGDMLALKLLDTLSQDPESILNTDSEDDESGVDAISNSGNNIANNGSLRRPQLNQTNKTAEVPLVKGPEQPVGKKKSQRRQIIVPRRSSTPLGLKVTFWVSISLVAIGLIGIILENSKPSWFQSIHAPSVAPSTIPITAPTVVKKTTTPKGNFKVTSSSSSSSTYQIGSSSFDLKIVSTGTPWIEVVNNSNSSVLFEGILSSGQSQSFTGLSNVTVQIGSANLTMSISSSSKNIGNVAPTQAPFTYNFISG